MAAPLASGALVIGVEGELVSRPYIEMTLAVMKSFGVTVETPDAQTFVIPEHAAYRPTEYAIEPDASAASYFFALPAIVGGRVTVQGLSRTSLQGDVAFADLLEQMGCRVVWQPDSVTVARDTVGSKPTRLVGLDVDMSDIRHGSNPGGRLAGHPDRIRNVALISGKETDRIAAPQASEVRRRLSEIRRGLLIRPKPLTE